MGALPARQGDWGLITVCRGGANGIQLEGPDTEAIQCYQSDATADVSTGSDLEGYDRYICSAVLTCIKHALSGR